MSQLIVLYALQWTVAILIAAAALQMRTASVRRAWRWIAGAGIMVAGWSTIQLYAFVSGSLLPHLDAALLLGAAALASAGFIRFNQVYVQHRWFDDQIPIWAAVGAIVVGVLTGTDSAGILFLATALLVLLIGFPALVRLNYESRRLWGPFTAATGMFLLFLALTLYRTTCVTCTATSLALPVAPQVQEDIIASQPVLMLSAVLLLAYGCYLFLHGIIREVDVDDMETTAVELVQTVVQNIGAIVGGPVAARMAADAIEDMTGTRPTVDGSEITLDTDIPDTDAIIDALTTAFAAIGPVGRRKVEETAERLEVNT